MVDVMELPQVRVLVEALRARDTDPVYQGAPILDVYGRISVNPETGETEKVDRQITDNLTEVTRRRARLGMVLRDDGRSAWSVRAKRPGWIELVSRLESGASQGVIAWHTDRLMRQPRDLEMLIGFGDRGLIVASCHGDYNLSNADDRFALRVITAAAAKSSDDTSRRQKRKAAARRAAGYAGGGPARWFGCQARKQESWVPEEQVQAERDAIAWAVRAHLDGLSLQAIGRQWVEQGLTTSQGQQWTATTVSLILQHPRVAGLLAHEGVVIGKMAGMEPIVSQQEWEELAAKFKTRRRGRPVGRLYLLSGMLQCSACGGRMSGKMSGRTRNDGSKLRRYSCNPMQDALGGGCSRISISCETTDVAVRDMVIRVLSDPTHAQQIARSSAALAKALTSLEAAKADADALGARLGRGEISLSVFDAAMEPMKARIARMESAVGKLRDAGADQASLAVGRDEVAAEWDRSDVEHRRAMVRRVAPKGFLVHPYDRSKPRASAEERLSVR